jgi:hypothetical protein
MKSISCAVFLLAVFVSSPLYAQGRPDSTATGSHRPASSGPASTGPGFVDGNGDGIDDRALGKGSGIRRGKDRFIDEDGDGICDPRATALGIRQRGAGAGLMMGADGKGKMRRLQSGGKP